MAHRSTVLACYIHSSGPLADWLGVFESRKNRTIRGAVHRSAPSGHLLPHFIHYSLVTGSSEGAVHCHLAHRRVDVHWLGGRFILVHFRARAQPKHFLTRCNDHFILML